MIDFSRSGRMITLSKSVYRMNHADHVICFNANVFTKSKGKIWWGDLNLTLDYPELTRLANELQEDVYVLRELDGQPILDRAVMTFTPA